MASSLSSVPMTRERLARDSSFQSRGYEHMGANLSQYSKKTMGAAASSFTSTIRQNKSQHPSSPRLERRHTLSDSYSDGRPSSRGGIPEIRNYRYNTQSDVASDHSTADTRYSSRHASSSPSFGTARTGRPLPHGPGPLLPANTYPPGKSFNLKKRQDTLPGGSAGYSSSKGPLKGNHEIGNSYKSGTSDRELSDKESDSGGYYREKATLTRKKSRSLTNIRAPAGGDALRSTPDVKYESHQSRQSTDYSEERLKKARKGFKISRSPSLDNILVKRPLQLSPIEKHTKDLEMLKISDSGSLSRNRHSSSMIDLPKKHLDSRKDMDKKYKKEQSFGCESSSVNGKPPLPLRRSSDSSYTSYCTSKNAGSSALSSSVQRKSTSPGQTSSQKCDGDGLVGLRNLGNTCFMNCIVQCLTKTKKLRDYFCRDDHVIDLNREAAPMKGKLAEAFARVTKEIWDDNNSGYAVNPSVLKSQVQRYAPRFTGFSQQDCQEFLRFLLEGLHDDLNVIKEKRRIPYTEDNSKLTDAEQAQLAWRRYENRDKSAVSDIFVGQLKSTLACTICENRSITFDPFWDLSLPIPSRSRTSISSKISLYDCFQTFTQKETLDGDEKPICERCEKRRKCYKQFSIERFPQILVIRIHFYLKRFSGYRYRTKLETLIDFPLNLDLSKFAANSGGGKTDVKYRLYGVSNHSGGTFSGHYTAYCRHPENGDWYVYNDSSGLQVKGPNHNFCLADPLEKVYQILGVDKISSTRVVSSAAYVLFYELCNQKSSL